MSDNEGIVFEKRDRRGEMQEADKKLQLKYAFRGGPRRKRRNKMDHHYPRNNPIKPRLEELTPSQQKIHYPNHMSIHQLLRKRNATVKVLQKFKQKVNKIYFLKCLSSEFFILVVELVS